MFQYIAVTILDGAFILLLYHSPKVLVIISRYVCHFDSDNEIGS